MVSARPVCSADGESVTISKKVYDELIEDQKIMIALQNAGVDSWEGYADAMATYHEEDK